MSATPRPEPRTTTASLLEMHASGRPIVVTTCYDALFAQLLEEAGVDVLLVGDSLGMVVQGHDSTVPVTLDQMVYHSSLVARGSKRALVVADMPFLTADLETPDVLRSAGRLMQEGGAQAVKLEGGQRIAPKVEALVAAGIPVMGHLGLTPQSVHVFGGYQTRATDRAAQEQLLEDAKLLERAGAFSIVLEKIPAEFAREVTNALSIPTIGIGAGVDCSGQVLVTPDLLGLFDKFRPKFVRRYADLGQTVREAVGRFADDVRERRFPNDDESF